MNKLKTVELNDEFDPRVSLVPERILVDLDYSVLSFLLEGRRDELRQGLNKLERTIRKNGAIRYLDRLVTKGCDRRAVLWLLHPFSAELIFTDARWSNKRGAGPVHALLGITSKKRRSLLKKLNEIAREIEIVNVQPQFASLLMLSTPLYPAWRLPRTLRTYARLLSYMAHYFSGNSQIYDSIAKARLTTYVQAVTGRSNRPRRRKSRDFHDEDIAALISSLTGDPECSYDAAAHRMWRHKHYRRLNMLDPDVKLHALFKASNIVLPPLRNS